MHPNVPIMSDFLTSNIRSAMTFHTRMADVTHAHFVSINRALTMNHSQLPSARPKQMSFIADINAMMVAMNTDGSRPLNRSTHGKLLSTDPWPYIGWAICAVTDVRAAATRAQCAREKATTD